MRLRRRDPEPPAPQHVAPPTPDEVFEALLEVWCELAGEDSGREEWLQHWSDARSNELAVRRENLAALTGETFIGDV